MVGALQPGGELGDATIRLTVNGTLRQEGRTSEMVWDLSALLKHLGSPHCLGPGDLIMTGTPAGVGAVGPMTISGAKSRDLPWWS